MPCDSRIPVGMTAEQREQQIKAALKKLEQSLSEGKVMVKIGPQGALAFAGWFDRDGVSDVCAYRRLTVAKSWALKQAVAKAEMMAGRKMDANAVGTGVHSHDGGMTWNKGH